MCYVLNEKCQTNVLYWYKKLQWVVCVINEQKDLHKSTYGYVYFDIGLKAVLNSSTPCQQEFHIIRLLLMRVF